MDEQQAKLIRTASLDIAYEESGPAAGTPVILLHGFPDDPRTWDDVVPPLVRSGGRVLVPYLRGYGPTRFRDPATPRSGQQAALGHDLLAFIDALGIERATLVGYDWGGRAACILAALWPERVRALVTIGGYNIQNIARATEPASPRQEHRFWYQWYFQTERGRAGLAAHRHALCRLLWELWSPNWRFDDATYARTAASFDNPDFVDVVIQSYRHRYRAAPGDPTFDAIEERLAAQPAIAVPTIVLHGAADGVDPPEGSARHERFFTGPYRRRVVPVAGHFLPREASGDIVDAVRELWAASEAR
ncbi:MAG: alpha/beta hydrolase [Alphaproteobacteria bacterium]|nr:alpha/beta hydrolase [Alphaproteobacteria bacterium]